MKSVLISIRPKWCEKIASGDKTIEVRKTRPKLEPPFRCYIYCTLQGAPELFREVLGGNVAKWNREKWADRKGSIIGEFTCDAFIEFPAHSAAPACYADFARMAPDEIHKCLGEKGGYGWHISDLKIYDKPRELGEFTGLRETRFGAEPVEIKRPPQSWCYVEGSDAK